MTRYKSEIVSVYFLKKKHFRKLNIKSIKDNNTFWKRVEPNSNNNVFNLHKITLV